VLWTDTVSSAIGEVLQRLIHHQRAVITLHMLAKDRSLPFVSTSWLSARRTAPDAQWLRAG
jgi:hypothetical protein